MNSLSIRREQHVADASLIPGLLDSEGIVWHTLDCQPWASDFPYKPQVSFRIAHTGRALLLHYRVDEETTAALATQDNGHVWEDSCCELFLMPKGSPVYYNVECNCIGTLLIASGTGRLNRQHASPQLLASALRHASLGRHALAPCRCAEPWHLALAIPVETLFFNHNIESLAGLQAKANVYKCGDRLPRPHFLALNPIQLPKPDFHCPAFFAPVSFE